MINPIHYWFGSATVRQQFLAFRALNLITIKQFLLYLIFYGRSRLRILDLSDKLWPYLFPLFSRQNDQMAQREIPVLNTTYLTIPQSRKSWKRRFTAVIYPAFKSKTSCQPDE